MSQVERLYKIDQYLRGGPKNLRFFSEAFEVTPSTIKRDIEFMRSRLEAPIETNRSTREYEYLFESPKFKNFCLPGLWFSELEIHALLTMQHLLNHLEPTSFLQSQTHPLVKRLNQLLEKNLDEAALKRVLIIGLGRRAVQSAHFEKIGYAVLQCRQVSIIYCSRGSGETNLRNISPQRLVYYRENWYIDAWCHLRNELRSFALDSIQQADLTELPCKPITAKQLRQTFGAAYGIFSGTKLQHATLRFSARRARWVAQEHWHADQKGDFDTEGNYILQIPYASHTELIMDILKYGSECEVVAPQQLRELVIKEIDNMQKKYKDNGSVASGELGGG